MEWITASAKRKYSPALFLSTLLTLALLLTAWQRNDLSSLVVTIPFSFVTYLLYFSVGTAEFSGWVRDWCGENFVRYLSLPMVLVALLGLYVTIGGGNPLKGNSWEIPLLFCMPVLFYRLIDGSGTNISWKDVIGVMLCILPYVMHDYPFNSDLPPGGGGFETIYLTFALIVAVYSMVVVRGLKNVGFVPFYSSDAIKTVLRGWAIFWVFLVAIGIPTELIKWVGYEPLTPTLIIGGLALVLSTLFGTALPEELFFRGTFMNLLQQRISQTGNWKHYQYGSLLLLPLAAVAGYTTDDKFQWFPILCAIALWVMTKELNRRQPALASRYTAQLIVSLLFGLAHYHVHSTIFMGLAMIAGWIYGYIYQRTGSVFYSALAHTLVNTSPAVFGFALIR